MSDCVKKAFDSREEANKRLQEIQKLEEGNDKKIPIRAYGCVKCHKFHLTSFTGGKQKKVMKIKRIRHANRLEDEAQFWMNRKQWKEEEDY